MFDLLIFTQYPKTYGPTRFKEEALKNGLSCMIKSYKYTDLNNLPDAKFVILREPTASKNIYGLRDQILNYYVSKGSKVLNADSYLKRSVLDKKIQEVEFKKGGIPHVETLTSDNLKYPFIAKAKLGSHGSHVFKINSKNDLDIVLSKYKQEDLLYQEFLSSGFDLRVIVLNGRVLGIMKRTPREGEFLSNFSQGGFVSKYDGSDLLEIGDIAIKTAMHFMLDYVGVDLMMGNNGEWKVLEVNRACQYKGFEQATGMNVASEVVKSALL
jgi:RimK family alpha-L-glutamate ligase